MLLGVLAGPVVISASRDVDAAPPAPQPEAARPGHSQGLKMLPGTEIPQFSAWATDEIPTAEVWEARCGRKRSRPSAPEPGQWAM